MPSTSRRRRRRPPRTITEVEMTAICIWCVQAKALHSAEISLLVWFSNAASVVAMIGAVVSIVEETGRMLSCRQMSSLGVVHRTVVLLVIALFLSFIGILVSKCILAVSTLYPFLVYVLAVVKLAIIVQLFPGPNCRTFELTLYWHNVATVALLMIRDGMMFRAALCITILVLWADNFLLRCNLT